MKNKEELLEMVIALYAEVNSLDDVLVDQKERYRYLKEDTKAIYTFIELNF